MVFSLGDGGSYSKPEVYGSNDSIPIGIFDGDLQVNLAEVFAE